MRICSIMLFGLFFLHFIRYLFRRKYWFAHVHALFLCSLTVAVALGIHHEVFVPGHIYIAFILAVVWAGDNFEEYGLSGIVYVLSDIMYVLVFAVVFNVIVTFEEDVRMLIPTLLDFDMWKGVLEELCSYVGDLGDLKQLLQERLLSRLLRR